MPNMTNLSPSDLQAWVDGQLDPVTSQAVADLVQRDPQAQALAEDLRLLSHLVRDHEPAPAPLPVKPDYFWARIQEGIQRLDPDPDTDPTFDPPPSRAPTPASPSRWLAWLLPACAAIALLVWLPSRQEPAAPNPGSLADARSLPTQDSTTVTMVGHEIETPDTGMASLTFYSAQNAMTVVWLDRVDLL
jgi:anti-sigma factor RsiW